jgi:hypothetical protein
MTTLMLLAVLSTGQITAPEPNGGWLSDYGVALKRTKELGKPLLIVIDQPDSAAARIEQVSHSRESEQANLLRHYVLCRVDASTRYGQAVAKAFGTGSLPYTAIIDKRAEHILFAKAGQFSSEEWSRTLTSHWQGVQPVSYRAASQANYYQPAYCAT